MTKPSREKRLHRWERGADRVPAFIERWNRGVFWLVSVVGLAASAGLTYLSPIGALLFAPVGVFVVTGVVDITQRRRTVLRNFPVLGHLRYFLESIRPELRQYFVEDDHEQTPFAREHRSIIYQRAKHMRDTVPFGTQHDVYAEGYEWLGHSLSPTHPAPETARVVIGDEQCEQPYSASILNISAMSFGSLSASAIRALNGGAAAGGFYHNTGEGGVSPYHLEPRGDLVWQVGTGYFGCRTPAGDFDPEAFAATASKPQVKMIEVKLSQGAKPAHGGILPAAKVTEEIAKIRLVEAHETVNSPPAHRVFDTPAGLLEFCARLRELSGGKPVGFKLCVGQPAELVSIVKAMLETDLRPDFITVDGSEGGTGAAPPEFSNSVGMPLADGLTLVHNLLVGAGLRDRVRIISAGKIATGFHLVRHLALGADLCNAARAMMFALGCIQALKCNTNTCPVGVATQNPRLMAGLDVENKSARVESFHDKTVESVLELVGAAGLESPADLRPHHVVRRISQSECRALSEIYPPVEPGCLLEGEGPEALQALWGRTSAGSFREDAVAAE